MKRVTGRLEIRLLFKLLLESARLDRVAVIMKRHDVRYDSRFLRRLRHGDLEDEESSSSIHEENL